MPEPSVPSTNPARRADPLRFEVTLRGRRVLVTGHTGFTGGWLSLWLHSLGCEVTGLALPPITEPNLFAAARIADAVVSVVGDIRDPSVVMKAMERAKPSVVFHLAAQPLVSQAFARPIETIATNVMGTAHVLEAARQVPGVEAVVCITTDKVYASLDGPWGHRETDRLGGKDPYSASKAAAELVAASYRDTLVERGNNCAIATARGGNIIGGGDWSEDRIIPDFVRALVGGSPLTLRRPDAVRPWQHVLALAHGYMLLASHLLDGEGRGAEGWNFGPNEGDAVPVLSLVERLSQVWQKPRLDITEGQFPESHFLQLDSSKSRQVLGWRPPLSLDQAITFTAEWFRDYHAKPEEARALTLGQIARYRTLLGEQA